MDNFIDHYDPSLKKARQLLLKSHGVFIVEGDLNDAKLLVKLLDVVVFMHVMQFAAQTDVRNAMQNPQSYELIIENKSYLILYPHPVQH